MDVTTTPARRQLDWVLARAAAGGRLTPGEIAERFDEAAFADRWSPSEEMEEIAKVFGAELSLESVVETQDGALETVVCGTDGRRWTLLCAVEDAAPHRITQLWFRPAPPPGTVIREALPEDGPALAALERRTPLRLGDTKVTYDRGSDYFATARLMDNLTVLVALVDGTHAGVYWGAVQKVRVGGEPRTLLLEHRVRVDPEFQRGGVFWTLVGTVRGMHEHAVDSIAFYVSPRNERTRRHVEEVPRWSAEPVRMLLSCAQLAGEPAGREAHPDDAGVIADVLNSCHRAEELYVPYDDTSLSARLSKDARQYGWPRVRVLGDAVVGVGTETLTMTFETPGDSRTSVRATALDHGFAPGCDRDYEALLRSWCGELHRAGIGELAVFTSPGSPTFGVLDSLAADREPFLLWTFDIEEPDGAAERGIYVDPVYF